MQKRKTARVVAAAAFCAAAGAAQFAAAGAAFADEARERELEGRVNELERRLTEVSDNMRGGYFTASSDLEARIAELERLQDKNGMGWVFKSGLKSEAADKAFAYQFYGRIQNDWVWWDAGHELEDALEDEFPGGTEFRRVRLGATGTMYGNVKFKSEIDFADSKVVFADVYMELTGCPMGSVRVGHFDEPFGLDRITSSRFITFMERNLIENSGITPGRNTGIMVHGNACDDRLTYQVGMFRESDDAGNDLGSAKRGEYNLTGRIAGRPIVEDDGNTYLHLGLAASYRDFSDGNAPLRYRARPSVHISPRFVDTGDLAGIEDGMLLGLEAAYVMGPLTLKGEYASVSGNGASGVDDFDFSSFALEASYWLTGESSTYDKGKAAFDRPKVKKNYGDGDGCGAWQIALGYDDIDLDDGDTYQGGQMNTIRAGVNWWLNPNTRVTLNVVRADADDLPDEGTAFMMRFQVDF